MAPVVDSVKLVEKHEREWKFSDPNATIPGGCITLKVVVDGAELKFQCQGQGQKHCLYGDEWCRFVRATINAGKTKVSLYKEDDEAFHRIKYY